MVKTRPGKTHTTARREFLKTAGLAAVGAPLILQSPSAGSPLRSWAGPYVQRQAYSCVVVGAGLSGFQNTLEGSSLRGVAHAGWRGETTWPVGLFTPGESRFCKV